MSWWFLLLVGLLYTGATVYEGMGATTFIDWCYVGVWICYGLSAFFFAAIRCAAH